MNLIGPQVRDIRMEQGLTQEELAAKYNIVGLGISRQLTDEEAALLAKALKVPIEELYP